MKKIKIKFNKNSVEKYFGQLVKHRGAFFVVFFGVLFVFTFNIIYQEAYLKINYINYEKSENFKVNEIKKDAIFKNVIEKIKEKERLKQVGIDKEYRNPFDFKEAENLGDSGIINIENDNEDEDDSSSDSDNDLESSNPVALPDELSLPLMY